MFVIMQINTHKYGYSEFWNKKLIKRRNNITQGWQFCSLKYRLVKRKGKKGKKNYYHMGDSNLVTHSRTNPAEQGLTSLISQLLKLSV